MVRTIAKLMALAALGSLLVLGHAQKAQSFSPCESVKGQCVSVACPGPCTGTTRCFCAF